MIFRQRVPGPPLGYFVENLWYYDDLEVWHTKEKLLPNGAIELILDLSEVPKKLYDNRDFSRSSNYRRAWISGMQPGYLVIGAAKGSSMMGAHFRTGGAAPFFGFPISELTGNVIELDLICKRQVLALRERILEAATIGRKFDLLEQYLLSVARARLEPDRTVAAALATLRTWPVLSLRDLAAQLGLSQKQMIARFDTRVGLTPKLTSRVFRFQKVLKRVHVDRAPDWPDVAVDCGYYDQAHLIHEFQEFAGVSPGFYATHQSEYPDYLILD
ncbi:MAG: helix-turn-helix domain-containing protein [Acidobacteria bacterium]|nr:helix-turn-helix domain-containing protein [Acidobacteriota bacterium]